MDIIERLEKLENLVRHDDEARTICADARAEIVRLRGGNGNAGAAANAVASGYAYFPWTKVANVVGNKLIGVPTRGV